MNMKKIEEMSDRELLAAYLTKTSPGFRSHDGQNQMIQNGRWGTCGSCPQNAQVQDPKECVYTDRSDHNIHSTQDGKFFEYGREISKAHLIETLLS